MSGGNPIELANDLRMWAKMHDLDPALVDDLIAAADVISALVKTCHERGAYPICVIERICNERWPPA